ncbi:MAG: endolytic transglycosylase MltG [Pseudomonadales bacterium]|nr:endolytic transglycosylase MltG [Pseudomonadales bacterium]
MKKTILLFLCTIPFFTMLSAGLALKELSKPLTLENSVRVDVVYGDSIYKVAAKLHKADIVNYPKLWVWYARAFDMAEKIKVGEYQVESGTSQLQVLDDIVKGKVVQYTVTFLEGWTTADAIKALHKSQGIVKTLEAKDHKLILTSIGADQRFSHSEGLLYPETYQYSRGNKDRDIMRQAYQRLIKELDAAWLAREKNLPYKNAYEALTMASIIERETAVESERKQIAGVFVRRLNKGMKLQTDPTVIYGMGDAYKGKIRSRDLRKPTPYNTYTIKALPPTPISLPTAASIKAALHPLDNGMIYFVAKGNGQHQFSKTLTQHNAAVKKYQLNRSKNYRSSPQ